MVRVQVRVLNMLLAEHSAKPKYDIMQHFLPQARKIKEIHP